jgi:S1-C subfamily serine protease
LRRRPSRACQHLVRAGGSAANAPFNDQFFSSSSAAARTSSSRNQLAKSLVSGVLISEDGYIVTNSHVIGSERT